LSPKRHQKTENLIQEFAVKADLNKMGLRGKPGVGFSKAKGGKEKPQMEDENFCEFPFNGDPNKGLFCVFDGHAGKEAAIAAKEKFPKELAKQLAETPGAETATDQTDLLRRTFEEVDKQLAEFEDQGCTATAVFLWKVGDNKYLQAANVGDSTAFLLRGDNTEWLTRDHKLSSPEERERIKSAGIELSDTQNRINGLAVSRALGDHFIKNMKEGIVGEPFISQPYHLDEEDSLVVLASDGLWDVISGKAAMSIAQKEENTEEMAKRLLQTAVQSSKCHDNVTVAAILL